MKFNLEKDNFGSFLVVLPHGEELIAYQTEMISGNKIPGLLQADLRRKNTELAIYYNITSKLTLQQMLSSRRISKYQLINILEDITGIMIGSSGFLLYNRCFILKWEMIYINPENQEISLVYVPFANDEDINRNLKRLVMDLIVNATYAQEDEGQDDIIQKIINYLKSETFNVTGLNRLISRMKEPQIKDVPPDIPEEGEKESNKKALPILAIILIIQVAVLVILYQRGEFIALLGGSVKTTMFLAGLILAAVDFFLYKIMGGEKPEPEINIDISKEAFDDRTTLLIPREEGTGDFFLTDMSANPIKEYRLKNEGETLIGRMKDSVDCHIEYNPVGKVHARALIKGGRCFLKDLDSTNGTYINDVRLQTGEERELTDGDRVTFADRDFLFSYKQ